MKTIIGNNKYLFIKFRNIIQEPILLKIGQSIVSTCDIDKDSIIEEKETINDLLDEINKSKLEKKINNIPDIGEKVEKGKFYIEDKECFLCLKEHKKTDIKAKEDKENYFGII